MKIFIYEKAVASRALSFVLLINFFGLFNKRVFKDN